MSQTSREVLLMRRALDGLSDPQPVDTDYAASTLPLILQAARRRDRDMLDEYYRDRRYDEHWHSNASAAMSHLNDRTKEWLTVQGQLCVKPPSGPRIHVQVLAAGELLASYNQLSANEQSGFIDLKRKDGYRDVDPRLVKWMTRMGKVYLPLVHADRLEPFDDKMREVTKEWLRYALDRGVPAPPKVPLR